MKLPSKDPRIDTTSFSISKEGKSLLKDKELSKAYEKKYASDILHNYRFITDKNNRESIRDTKGRFVSKQVREKVSELKTISIKKTTHKIKVEKKAPYGRRLKGSFMKANYAITSLCTCEVMKVGYEREQKGQIIKHYYTVSSNSKLTYGELISSHNLDYKDHELLDIKIMNTKEVSFE